MTEDETIELSRDDYEKLQKNIERLQYERAVFKECLVNIVKGMYEDDFGNVMVEIGREQKTLLERTVESLL